MPVYYWNSETGENVIRFNRLQILRVEGRIGVKPTGSRLRLHYSCQGEKCKPESTSAQYCSFVSIFFFFDFKASEWSEHDLEPIPVPEDYSFNKTLTRSMYPREIQRLFTFTRNSKVSVV